MKLTNWTFLLRHFGDNCNFENSFLILISAFFKYRESELKKFSLVEHTWCRNRIRSTVSCILRIKTEQRK
jgi:hypothetical protein